MLEEWVDLSEWQGEINLGLLANFIGGAVIRGGDGRHRDSMREKYADGLRAQGVSIESYHFLRWSVPVAETVALCRETYEAVGGKRLWLDCEDDHISGLTLSRINWLMDVEAALGGINLGIYSGAWWWQGYLGNTASFTHLPLWTAAYPYPNGGWQSGTALVEAGGPSLYGGWQQWEMWQYSSAGRRLGIAGDVDLNIRRVEEKGGDMPKPIKEADKPEVWLPLGGFIVHIPTIAAFYAQGWKDEDIETVNVDDERLKLPRLRYG